VKKEKGPPPSEKGGGKGGGGRFCLEEKKEICFPIARKGKLFGKRFSGIKQRETTKRGLCSSRGEGGGTVFWEFQKGPLRVGGGRDVWKKPC